MEGEIKVKIEKDDFQEEEVDLALIGGYDTSETPEKDPLELNLKVEKVKTEDMISYEESGNKDPDYTDMTSNYDSDGSCSRLSNLKSGSRKRGNSLVCNVCVKSFSRIFHLETHMRMHTGEKPFDCKICNKSFSRLNNLQRHVSSHTGEKPFNCKECDKSFTRLCHLQTHMHTHTGEKPFKCRECGTAFSRLSSLHQHIKIHTQEKPFECKECGKSFSRSHHLQRHMSVHTMKSQLNSSEVIKHFLE